MCVLAVAKEEIRAEIQGELDTLRDRLVYFVALSGSSREHIAARELRRQAHQCLIVMGNYLGDGMFVREDREPLVQRFNQLSLEINERLGSESVGHWVEFTEAVRPDPLGAQVERDCVPV